MKAYHDFFVNVGPCSFSNAPYETSNPDIARIPTLRIVIKIMVTNIPIKIPNLIPLDNVYNAKVRILPGLKN